MPARALPPYSRVNRRPFPFVVALLALALIGCESDEGVVADSLAEVSMDLFASAAPSDGSDPASVSPSASASGVGSSAVEPATVSPSASEGGIGFEDDCAEAFRDVPAFGAIADVGGLQDALDSVDSTILACDELDEWRGEAEDAGLSTLGVDAEEFVRYRCDQNRELALAPICQDL